MATQMIARFKKSMRQFHVPPLDPGPTPPGPNKPPLRSWTMTQLLRAWAGVDVPTPQPAEVLQDVITPNRVYEMKPELFLRQRIRPQDVYIEDIREAMHEAALFCGVLKW